MGKNWGRTPVTNADKRAATQTKYLVEIDGGTEERIDRRPLGKVERFVDPDGGVVSLQIYADGDPKRHESEIRRRAELHRKGFIEFAKCPIKHGTRNSSPIASKDFAKLEKGKNAPPVGECKTDPKVMQRKDGDLYAGCSCPHIEALIVYRREKAADAYAKRNAAQVKAEQNRATRQEFEAAQAKALNELLTRQATPRRGKDAPE